MKKVLVTGADGFVGKNLQLHLADRKDVQVLRFTRESDVAQLPHLFSIWQVSIAHKLHRSSLSVMLH